MNNLIDISNLKKSYHQDNFDVNVLKKINLKVNRGDFISIIGPSGSGKTTLLNILGTIDKFDDGQYFFNNENIKKFNESNIDRFRNENIGFVHQFHYLINELTTVENTILPLLILGKTIQSATNEAKKLLIEFGLEDKINSKIKYLSGGEQQRVAIARSMINNPNLIIADEMTGNLDEKQSESIIEFFLEQAKIKKQTIIFVTHNKNLALKANKKYQLENGILINYN